MNDAGKTKIQIYTLANQWIVREFNDSRSVLEIQDKSIGQLMGKGSFSFSIKLPGSFGLTTLNYQSSFVLAIDAKDGKHRYTISTIELHEISGTTFTTEQLIYMCYHGIARKANRVILEAINMRINKIILSLNHAISLEDTDF